MFNNRYYNVNFLIAIIVELQCFEEIKPVLDVRLMWVCWKEEKKKRKEEKTERKEIRKARLSILPAAPVLVVKWTRFCGREPASHALPSLSFLHFIFPRVSSFFATSSIFSFYSSRGISSILLVFFASLFRLLIFFPAFRNGRTLLRWSLRGAEHFWSNGPFSRTMGLCKLNERDEPIGPARENGW